MTKTAHPENIPPQQQEKGNKKARHHAGLSRLRLQVVDSLLDCRVIPASAGGRSRNRDHDHAVACRGLGQVEAQAVHGVSALFQGLDLEGAQRLTFGVAGLLHVGVGLHAERVGDA